MSTLTGQQIKDTYDGLLKLQDSTNGITANLQPIQDGLGNNTGARIATNYFTAPNVVNLDCNLIPDFMGVGFQSGVGTAIGGNSAARPIYTIFYDPGVLSYSAISYNLGTLTSTNDVMNMYFYSLQLVPGQGCAPKDLIMSGITMLTTGSTGIKTTTLPSTLSFSGTGGGFYVALWYYTNSTPAVTATVRYGGPIFQIINHSFAYSLGLYQNAPGGCFIGNRLASMSASILISLDSTPIKTSYSVADIQANMAAAISGAPGFVLRPIV